MLTGMMDSQLVIYTAYGLVFAATFLIARLLLKEQEARQAEERLDDSGSRDDKNFLLKITRPFFTQYVVPMIRGKDIWDVQRRKYRRKLIAGGLKADFTPDEFIAFKFFQILFFPMVGGLLRALEMIDASGLAILASGVVGWFYPDIWLNSRIKYRQKQIRRALPFIVDLLALSTEAGLDFIGAIGRVVEKAVPSPFVEELEQLLKEIRVGSSRAQALREMAERVDMREINSFVAILISADQMGASIGRILRQQSEQVRSDRFIRAEKEGAAAQPKLILVTVMFIFPSVLLMIAAPFVISFFFPGLGGK